VQPEAAADRTAVRLAVDVRRFPWIKRLAADYIHDFSALEPFFAGNPASPLAWRDAIARAQQHVRARRQMVSILHDQQQHRGAPPEARAAAARLIDPRSVAVVTGQQAGLFGGPAFTLLKAITAIKLAGALEAEQGIPVVAVFWIDSEDHDWNEISSCAVLDENLRLQAVALDFPPEGGDVPVAAIRLDGSVEGAIEHLQRVLVRTEHTAWLLNTLRDAYRKGLGTADAFGRLMEQLLGARGLVVFDAADRAAKPLVRHIFAKEVESQGRTVALAAAAGAELVARGYHAQFSSYGEGLALFRLDGRRSAVRATDGRFSAGEESFDVDTLLHDVESNPGAFSPSVLLRPIVQDALFPTVGYVAGPNELAYLAQLRGVYEQFGVPMPLIHQRASATLLDSAGMRFLTRYKVPFEALQSQDDSVLNRLLESQLPPTVETALRAVEEDIANRMATLITAVPALDPTLEGAVRSSLGRFEHELRSLRMKIIHAAKRRDDTLRRQFNRTRAQAFPGGHPQERALGSVYFLNRYGPLLVEHLQNELPTDMGYHWVVSL
jgi:bacillithiol biosynthesis cysteine-adding enzyme BshC